MTIEILTLAELQEAAARADFAKGSESRITTMDFQPIDSALNAVWGFFKGGIDAGVAFPTLWFKGDKQVPAPPEFMRKHLPESKWGPTVEKIELQAIGARLDDFLILRFTSAKKLGKPERSYLWGLPAGQKNLVFHRSIPIQAAMAFDGQEARAAFARQEGRLIDEAAKGSDFASGSPRI